MRFAIAAVLGVVLLFAVTTLYSGSSQSKPIPVGIKVEAEGPNAMWPQSATDLSATELQSLQSLVAAEIAKQPDVKVVPLDYPEDYIGVIVVAVKLSNGKGGQWYVASSALTVAFKDGKEGFVTHNVLAGADVAALAKGVGVQLASARLRAALHD